MAARTGKISLRGSRENIIGKMDRLPIVSGGVPGCPDCGAEMQLVPIPGWTQALWRCPWTKSSGIPGDPWTCGRPFRRTEMVTVLG